MIIRFIAPCGWEEAFNDHVVKTCKAHGLTFIDRANVLKPTAEGLTCEYLSYDNTIQGPLPLADNFAWFAHRGMDELPFTLTHAIPVELL